LRKLRSGVVRPPQKITVRMEMSEVVVKKICKTKTAMPKKNLGNGSSY
jgi:hypothetical protein